MRTTAKIIPELFKAPNHGWSWLVMTNHIKLVRTSVMPDMTDHDRLCDLSCPVMTGHDNHIRIHMTSVTASPSDVPEFGVLFANCLTKYSKFFV